MSDVSGSRAMPMSMKFFEALYLSQSVIILYMLVSLWASAPALPRPPFAILITLALYSVPIVFAVLALLVGRRRSLLVRIILVVVGVVISVVVVPLFLLGSLEVNVLSTAFDLIKFVAMVLLFTESSREWLSPNEGRGEKSE